MASSTVRVQALGPGRYRVEVHQDDERTTHSVLVRGALLDDLGLSGADPVTVVEESFRFLLAREPAGAILREFSLEDIARYFPEYYEELRGRLAR